MIWRNPQVDPGSDLDAVAHDAASAERAGRRRAISVARGQLVRGIRPSGRIFRRRGRRLQSRLRGVSGIVHAAIAVDRERADSGGRGDRQADGIYRPLQGNDEPAGGQLQRQHHRRFAPDARGRRRGLQYLLRVPARRQHSRTAQDSSDAERALLVERQGRQQGQRDRHRLRADRRADLLRLSNSRKSSATSSIRARRLSSFRSAPTNGRAICACAIARRRARSKTSATS